MIQLFPFSSFQQIPGYFFNSEYNDPNKHSIENLYMKYVPETGGISYYFQIHYKPIFRFNSVTAEISDNSARSFPVLCDISYLIQMPQWLFDTYDGSKITRINLGLSASDSISSIVADNNFLSEGNKSFTINGVEYIIVNRYIIDPTSPNYQPSGKIVVPKGSDQDVIVQIAKLYPRKSTVVSWVGAHKSLPTEINEENFRFWLGCKDVEIKTLDPSNYIIVKNEVTGEEELIIITNNEPHLTPDLDSPIIISFLAPVSEKYKEKTERLKNSFKSPIYEIRDQKAWKKQR